jgi:hypothetical protein
MKSRNIEININKVFAILFPEGVRFLYVFVSSKLFLMFAVYLSAAAAGDFLVLCFHALKRVC